jgi:hypothetical protein
MAMNWGIDPGKQGKMPFRMLLFLFGIILFFATGCTSRFFMYKDTLTTELVTFEELPRYNKVIVCQGPAILDLASIKLFGIVRCFDSNNDGQMLSLKHKGIDVFEYNLPEIRKHNDGQFYPSFAAVPYAVIIDMDFDGIGDSIYLFRTATVDGHLLYEKIKIGNHHLVMDDFAPARFRLSDFKSFHAVNHPRY